MVIQDTRREHISSVNSGGLCYVILAPKNVEDVGIYQYFSRSMIGLNWTNPYKTFIDEVNIKCLTGCPSNVQRVCDIYLLLHLHILCRTKMNISTI